MNVVIRRTGLALLLVLAGCVSVPPGPPPEIQRLEGELARLHDDPRIAPNAQPELQNADVAVNTLARQGRQLDEPTFRHGVYIADRLIQIAEASGMARYQEQRGNELSAERERLQAQAARPLPDARAVMDRGARPFAGYGQVEHDQLAAIQTRLSGVESHLDERGLVVRLGDFMFENDGSQLRAAGRHSLDTLALALRNSPPTTLWTQGYTSAGDRDGRNRDVAAQRAANVRDYLISQGVAQSQFVDRVDTGVDAAGNTPDRGYVDVVVRMAGR